MCGKEKKRSSRHVTEIMAQAKAAGQPGVKLSETTAGPVRMLCIGADPS